MTSLRVLNCGYDVGIERVMWAYCECSLFVILSCVAFASHDNVWSLGPPY